jgi:hypothetical protein
MNDREAAIADMLPVAKRVAGQFVKRNGRMSFPEALSAATLGMIEAIDSKDRTNSVPLEGWACMKMRWQMGLDYRAHFAPRRKVRSEFVSIDNINPAKFAVVPNQSNDATVREEIDAAIQSIKPNYRKAATEYLYGPTRNIVEIAKRTGIPIMTCKRSIWAVRRELRARLERA